MGGGQLRRQQHARGGRAEAREHEHEQLDAVGADARVLEHLLVAAQAVDVGADGELQRDDDAQRHEDHHQIIRNRNAQQRSVADELVRVREASEGISVVEEVGRALGDLADDQRGHEGGHVQIGHEGAGDQAQQDADRQRDENRNRHGYAVGEQNAHHHAAEGDVAADGEVNALDHDDLGHAHRRDGNDGALANDVEQVAQLQKVGYQRTAEQKQGDAHDRNDQRLLILLEKLHLGLPLFQGSLSVM